MDIYHDYFVDYGCREDKPVFNAFSEALLNAGNSEIFIKAAIDARKNVLGYGNEDAKKFAWLAAERRLLAMAGFHFNESTPDPFFERGFHKDNKDLTKALFFLYGFQYYADKWMQEKGFTFNPQEMERLKNSLQNNGIQIIHDDNKITMTPC